MVGTLQIENEKVEVYKVKKQNKAKQKEDMQGVKKVQQHRNFNNGTDTQEI